MPNLVNVAENVWAAETTMNMPGGVEMNTRMTAVRLADGTLWVHSPVRMDDALAGEIDKLGQVAHIVAPNRFHHLFFKACAERYPSARTYGPPGLQEKVPLLRIDEVLGEQVPAAWANDFAERSIQGAAEMSEVVFLHQPTRTLVVSDLLFNIVRPPNLATKILTTMTGTRGKLAKSRVWWLLIKDKPAFETSVRKVMEWDFDKLIMAHGEVVEANARAKVTKVLGL